MRSIKRRGKTRKDYTEGQPRYTLLKKEKRNVITNEMIVQYDRITLKNTNKPEN